MTNSTSYIKQLINLNAVILLLLSSLAAPLLISGSAVAESPMTVCQVPANTASSILAAPTLITPSNDSTNPNGFDFSWSSVSGAAQYDWETSLVPDLNADGSFVSRAGYHRLDATFINEGGSPSHTYYWHVRAVASDGTTGAWSQIWQSTIDSTQTSYLAAPTLTSPGNGATCNIYSQDFDFTWDAPASDGGLSPLKYIFQSGRSATTDPISGEFTDQPWTDYDIPTTHIFDGGSPSATYYWHVRAVASNGTLGPWSATWVVTITHDAPAPVDTPPSLPPATPVGDDAASTTSVVNPVTAQVNPTNTTTSTPIKNLFIPPSADIAAVLGTNPSASPAKPQSHKASNSTDLAANVGTVSENLFTRNVAWVIAFVLALSAAIFAYYRRQTSSK